MNVGAEAPPALWYFAYGANMAAETMTRRGLTPARSVMARLDDYALRFSQPGIPLLEPGFANIEPAPGARVFGVVHAMSAEELRRLDRFEGRSYRHERVRVTTEALGVLEAIAYRNPRARTPRTPSQRYKNLLLQGAREHHLPQDYIDALEAHPARHVPVLSALLLASVGVVDRTRRAVFGALSGRRGET